MTILEKDSKTIERQLGRVPRGVLRVVKYTKDGQPMVIMTDPIISRLSKFEVRISNFEWEPFPTLYYLTDPKTVEMVSRLEDKGLIKKFENEIAENNVLRHDFLKAQEQYIKERKRLAGKKLNELEESKRLIINETGIGGVKDLTKIKCLHAHYAHYLATGKNPIGALIHQALVTSHEAPQHD